MTQGGIQKTVHFINSILGVTVLTLPYCFRQCGIVLGILLLIFWSWLTYESSMMVVNTAIKTNKKTYCGLAQLSFGKIGKLTSEICILGFMMGVCTAFHVVMGDLAVHLLQGLIGEEVTQNQRMLLIFAICCLVVLPLSLTASDSVLLSTTAVVGFACFMVVTLCHCCHRLLSSGQEVQVRLWLSDGLLECLPIYGTAFSCHPQLLPGVCVKGLDVSKQRTMHAIKHAFAATLVFYTLCHDGGGACGALGLCGDEHSLDNPALPPGHWHPALRGAVETVLGVVGTTTGAIICYIFPSLMQSKLSKETVSGKIVLTVGFSLLVTPVYANVARVSKEEIKLEPMREVPSLFELKAATQPTLWTETTVQILMNEQAPNAALNEEKGTEYNTSDSALEDDTRQKRPRQRNQSEINRGSESTLRRSPTLLRFLLKTSQNISSFT
ncbi:putative sodium-coupled neutral amino acid transporter 10 isoform X3 [Polyodon spathula]|uniref:putative sodium-coupled neutral amino acid transporter 10 isoform X3 n=1 Tax=Polyodon spathula TaxID=7913 RepID=UPI001B7DA903|nr:putative sodium-coupled neutral amino acid transporter 10 isoform X3 [Polyodon spathula]